jgi:hypothetical protein
VQRTVSLASKVYDEQFGIQLELAAVGRWSAATRGMRVDALLDDLRDRPREGNDILLGMTARPLDEGTIAGQAETPTPTSPYNGAYGVVYATPDGSEPHLRTLLHEIAHMFGALDVTDERDPSWEAGSWMSYAPATDGQAQWIDADNRKRVLERKDKPFAPEGASVVGAPPPSPSNEETGAGDEDAQNL